MDDSVRVPNEYVKDGEIVLNISFDATSALNLGNEFIEFKGRFGGVARDIYVPVERVLAIYARENGQGMAFPMMATSAGSPAPAQTSDAKPAGLVPVKATDGGSGPDVPRPTSTTKPSLTRIK